MGSDAQIQSWRAGDGPGFLSNRAENASSVEGETSGERDAVWLDRKPDRTAAPQDWIWAPLEGKCFIFQNPIDDKQRWLDCTVKIPISLLSWDQMLACLNNRDRTNQSGQDQAA